MDSKILFVLLSMAAIYFALKYTIGKSAESIQPWWDPNKNTYILWFSIVCGIVLYYGISSYGNKIPGSFFERAEYETMMYVLLYPDHQKITSHKLPAQIRKTDREYYIDYVVMADGSYLDLSGCEGTVKNSVNLEDLICDDPRSLILNKRISIHDSLDRDWIVELTNEPVN
jgi:hypothetical protein